MTYLLKRGSKRRAHLCAFDRAGRPTWRPLCGSVVGGWNLTSNVPWGRPTCKHCRRVAERGA